MRALDLFCGVGGASVGLERAGFEVVGVDHLWQPDYPGHFVRIDWTMDTRALANAIPPAYAEFIGREFIRQARAAA